MGIDVYAYWRSQTRAEQDLWTGACDLSAGHLGYLREAYGGGPYATMYLFHELFEDEEACQPIAAAVLRKRLKKTLRIIEKRMRKQFSKGNPYIDMAKESFIDFVELCERKEREDGEPVHIFAFY